MKHLRVIQLGLVMTLAILILIVSLGISVAQGERGNRTGDLYGRPEGQEQIQESAQASGYNLSWWTVDGGGGEVRDGVSGYTLGSTAGQPDASVWQGDGYTLAGGFWGGATTEYRVYLPLVLRNY